MSPWFRFATPVLKNTGSVARDHLASERTYLAWIRTGLGFVALGIAIERFSQLDLQEILHPVIVMHHQQQHQRVPVVVQGGEHQERHRQHKLEKELEKQDSQLLVGTLLGLGAGSLLYGTSRYFSNMKYLEGGNFKPAYHGPAVLGAAVAGLAGGVYGSTMRRRRTERLELDRS
jgi:uncharacterized membrane protein YidH (DUF202 family)